MTCEIAVMNKRGLALAADSAVTVGNGRKIFHHAEKLFELNAGVPVGIMVSGMAEIMGMPWDIVIRSYTRHLGERRFDRLEDYAQDFFGFIESASSLFPETLRQDWFRSTVESYWRDQLLGPLAARRKQKRMKSPRTASSHLADLLKQDHAAWQKYPAMEKLGSGYGDVVIGKYGAVLDDLERKLFSAYSLTSDVRHGLRMTVKSMYAQEWFHPQDRSWVTFAGMGEVEPFPSLLAYCAGSIAADRLRSAKIDEVRVTRETSAFVVPIGQTDMIDEFYRGIHVDLDGKLDEIVARAVSNQFGQKVKKLDVAQIDQIKATFRKELEKEINGKYKRPLIAAVDALARHDLAKIAETLVSLTAFRKRMSVDQKETVGGSIDVAILSKAEGFVWKKRNDPHNKNC